MKKFFAIVASFLMFSCSQQPEEISDTRLPKGFPLQGSVSVERYSYGGAPGGYRYYVYGISLDGERELVYTGRSNKLLSLSFPKNRSVLLNFCGSTPQQRRVTNLPEWQGLPVRRLC